MYKLIEAYHLEDFNEQLAKHVDEGWMPFNNHLLIVVSNKKVYSCMMYKFNPVDSGSEQK